MIEYEAVYACVCVCVSGSSCSLPDSLSLPLTYSVLQWRMGSVLPPAGAQTSELVSVKEKLTETQRALQTTKHAVALGLILLIWDFTAHIPVVSDPGATLLLSFFLRARVCVADLQYLAASLTSSGFQHQDDPHMHSQ